MWWGLAVLGGVYFAAGKLGLRLAFEHASATAVWPPTGIALAAMLLYGYRVWPAIFVGAYLVNATTVGSVWTSLGIAAGNTLEGLLGVWLVRRWASGGDVFARAWDIFKFVALAGLFSTTVSATVGVTSLATAGYASWERFGAIWLTWWLGDVAGALVVTPVLVLWGTDRSMRFTRAKAFELALVLAAVVLAGIIVFDRLGFAGASNYPLEFLCIPPLVYAAFRFGQREAATCVALLAGLAIVGTLAGHGPFARASPNDSLLLLHAFMMTLTIVTLPLAAIAREPARSEAPLAQSAAIVAAAGAAHEINNPLAVVMGQAQLLSDEIAGPGRQRVGEILQAIDRIRAIVARMRHVTRVELMDGPPGLPPMLDINRSSEPEVSEGGEGPAAGSCLVIVAREERARRESRLRMLAGDETEVIVDRRLGERRRSASAGGGRRRGPRRRQDISLDLQTRGWALVRR